MKKVYKKILMKINLKNIKKLQLYTYFDMISQFPTPKLGYQSF